MTYRQAVDYLYSKLPVYQRIGRAAFKLDLSNIRALCAHLGDPQTQFPAVHIAGTNGKGSVAHQLAAVFQAQGYKTGLHTSPHYKDLRERAKINGHLMPKDAVVSFVEQHRSAIETIEPSFFELSVALAFEHFARQKVDIAIIETGLGGRFDATNILSPVLSIITNIGLEHRQLLGDTLAEIAFEKAGIIKPQVPVIIGQSHPETDPVFLEQASATGSPLRFADHQYVVKDSRFTKNALAIDIGRDSGSPMSLKIAFQPTYQIPNLVTALAAAEFLNEKSIFPLTKAAIVEGLRHFAKLTGFTGRWQILAQQPLTIADSAHNPDGLKAVLRDLTALPNERLHIVLGMVADKDTEAMLAVLPAGGIYYFTQPDLPRALDARLLKKEAGVFGLLGESFHSVKKALPAAQAAARPNDLIFVGGSAFVVAEAL